MLLDWASRIPCWAPASSHLCAGCLKRSPLPKKALAVPHSLEAGVLAPDIIIAMLLSLKVAWRPICSGYQEAIVPVFGGESTENIT